jgi:hypothetical protein
VAPFSSFRDALRHFYSIWVASSTPTVAHTLLLFVITIAIRVRFVIRPFGNSEIEHTPLNYVARRLRNAQIVPYSTLSADLLLKIFRKGFNCKNGKR